MGWKITTGIVLVGGGLAALVAIPNFVGRQCHPSSNACIAQLKQIQSAIEMYALENKLNPTNRVTAADISGGSKQFIRPLINVDFTCPAGGVYTITTIQEPPRCSVPGHTIDDGQ